MAIQEEAEGVAVSNDTHQSSHHFVLRLHECSLQAQAQSDCATRLGGLSSTLQLNLQQCKWMLIAQGPKLV